MSSQDVAPKIISLEDRAAGYVATPGPAGEVQQRARTVIADHMVTVILRDGRVHHFEIEARGGFIEIARTREEAVAALAA